jgi:nicotinate-nucleotide adenylyltransferase
MAWIAFDPDPTSATALRRDNPDWATDYVGAKPRDAVTGRLID